MHQTPGVADVDRYLKNRSNQIASVNEVHKVMVLAAGEGTRLGPLTLHTPKVLLTVGNDQPLIVYILAWLKYHGIYEVAINLHHLGDKIKAFLSDGSRYNLKVVYSAEPAILGTAGGVKKLEKFFDTTFVVVYGDILTDFNLKDMILFHHWKKAIATIAIVKLSNTKDVGFVEMDSDGRILSFIEKPSRCSVTTGLVNGAVYVLEKAVFDHIPKEGAVDFAYDTFPKLIRLGLPVYGYQLKPDDYLVDIGTINNYQAAKEAVEAGVVKINIRDMA